MVRDPFLKMEGEDWRLCPGDYGAERSDLRPASASHRNHHPYPPPQGAERHLREGSRRGWGRPGAQPREERGTAHLGPHPGPAQPLPAQVTLLKGALGWGLCPWGESIDWTWGKTRLPSWGSWVVYLPDSLREP